jgi:tetratricopeptide (TPR) repeat protein
MLKHLKRMLTLTNRTRQHSPEVYRALQAAEGYVYLGLFRDALRELDAIPAADQEDSDVMVARIRILLHLGRWSNAVRLSTKGAALHKEEDEFTVQHAFALHQLDKGEEAARVLLEAPEWLRKTGILHYNLGCYEARWGNLHIARQCVATAIEINAAIQKNARHDPDLLILWDSKSKSGNGSSSS